MLKYLVGPGWVQGPKTFRPERELAIKGNGQEFKAFLSGEEYHDGLLFEGVVGGKAVLQAICPQVERFSSHFKSSKDFLNCLDGFFGGFFVDDCLNVFRDHAGLIPLYVCGSGNMATNVLAEARVWGSVKPVEPGTLKNTLYNTAHSLSTVGVVTSTDMLRKILIEGVRRFLPKRPAVFFSGGLDSFIVVEACVEAGLEPLLLTLGVEGGHDLVVSAKAAKVLQLEVHRVVIGEKDVREALEVVENLLGDMSVMELSIASAMYLLAREAFSIGCRVAALGQGADELFAGYKKYEKLYLRNELESLVELLKKDLEQLRLLGLSRDFTAARAGGVFLVPPFMFRSVLEFGLSTALDDKIRIVDGMVVRKKILRDLVREAGFEVFAGAEKKALQYGSGIEKIVRRLKR